MDSFYRLEEYLHTSIHSLFEWRIGKHRKTKEGNDLIIDLDYQVDMENGKRESNEWTLIWIEGMEGNGS